MESYSIISLARTDFPRSLTLNRGSVWKVVSGVGRGLTGNEEVELYTVPRVVGRERHLWSKVKRGSKRPERVPVGGEEVGPRPPFRPSLLDFDADETTQRCSTDRRIPGGSTVPPLLWASNHTPPVLWMCVTLGSSTRYWGEDRVGRHKPDKGVVDIKRNKDTVSPEGVVPFPKEKPSRGVKGLRRDEVRRRHIRRDDFLLFQQKPSS